ncbi:MAG: hypothetical protein J7578_07085 [Chitinophagaceae bacterium]|nr:hypothetical protein [Chitinophagaceae bacterium]
MRTLSMAGILLLAALCIHGKIEAGDMTSIKVERTMIDYTWYWDMDYIYPVGTYGSVIGELNRLKVLYPSNAFSATPQVGLHEFEYGYFSLLVNTVIYSDRP